MARTKTETAARRREYTTEESLERALYVALELSKKSWLLGMTIGMGQKPRRRRIDAGDLRALGAEVAAAKARFDLPAEAPVYACYEVGREGFWPYRALESLGVSTVPVGSSSIEVKRGRRAKTDRLDVTKLLTMLVRYHLGEEKVWSVVRVPSVEAEDFRQLHRERTSLLEQRTAESNRIRSLLVTQGLVLEGFIDERLVVAKLRCWDGSPLPPYLHLRLENGLERLRELDRQLAELEVLRRAMLEEPEAFPAHTQALRKIAHLMQLKSVGLQTAWVLVAELFGWRQFDNRKQLGGASGLCGTPYNSGQSSREQGISRGGNAWVRPTMIELGWLWRRWQAQSQLAGWFEERWGEGSSRQRKIGIVGVSRKLLIALWRYLEHGDVPEGARLKAA